MIKLGFAFSVKTQLPFFWFAFPSYTKGFRRLKNQSKSNTAVLTNGF